MEKTFFELLTQIKQQIFFVAAELAEWESQVLLAAAFKLERRQLLVNLNQRLVDVLTTKQITVGFKQLDRMIQKRQQHMPLVYILGYADFGQQRYSVVRGVLIPRSETELLVMEAVHLIKAKFAGETGVVLELGFGSGVVSLELAKLFPNIHIYAWDVSKKAYLIAMKNKQNFKAENVTFIHKDFFKDSLFWQKLLAKSNHSLMLSNPPYISCADISKLATDVKNFEPKKALNGGNDGLRYYRKLFKHVGCFGIPMIFELGIGQQPALAELARKADYQADFVLDYQQIPRIMVAKK